MVRPGTKKRQQLHDPAIVADDGAHARTLAFGTQQPFAGCRIKDLIARGRFERARAKITQRTFRFLTVGVDGLNDPGRRVPARHHHAAVGEYPAGATFTSQRQPRKFPDVQ